MNPKQYQRAKEIFNAACDRNADGRTSWVEAECGSDVEVRETVHRLLERAGGADTGFLATPAMGGVVKQVASEAEESVPVTAPLPETIGRYRILRRIGEGGMGAVYEAQQDEPSRRVALKVIAPGRMSPQLLRRFRHEAEVLGQLQHPGIAAIYEASLGEGGQPFFAMELVEGPMLLDFADGAGLTVRDRLALMAKVCDAVHHAHQKGVIHRDLKPANILVANGTPKVLDFGIARATDADTRAVTLGTDLGQLLGTVPYMSPEQAGGDPTALDTRSDVYALGVVLFELLTGRLPYDVQGKLIHEAIRVIREEEPTHLSAIDRFLRGDVDTIVAKTLAKEPERRYQSAAEMAADIRRHLADEPIAARPATTMYQLRKFVRRNRILVGGTTGIAIALLLGTVFASVFAIRANRNADLANERELVTRRLAYRSSIMAAAAALEDHDVVVARQNLEAAPPELRNWEWRHLVSRLDQSTLSFDASAARVSAEETTMTFTSDGRRLLVGGGGLAQYDAESGVILAARDGGTTERVLGISPDATRVAIATDLWRLEMRDADSGEAIRRIDDPRGGLGSPGRMRRIRRVIFEPDNRAFGVIRWFHEKAELYDEQGRSGRTLAGEAELESLTFSPDARWAATAELITGSASVWDVRTGALRARLIGHSDELREIVFSPDGATVATASRDSTVRLWNVATGECLYVLRGHTDEVTTVVFLSDGRMIASAGRDRTIRLWSVDEMRSLGVLHGAGATITNLAVAPDGVHLASLDESATVRLWDVSLVESSDVLRGHDSYAYSVAISPDGARIASVGWDGYVGDGDAVRLWDAASGAPITSWGSGWYGHRVWFDTHGTRLGVWERSKGIFITDAATGRAIGTRPPTLEHFASIDPATERLLEVHDIWENGEGSDATTPGPTASGYRAHGGDRFIQAGRVWDVKTGSHLHDLEEFASIDKPRHGALSPDGELFAVSFEGGLVRLWSVASGRLLFESSAHSETVLAFAFSPDGTRLASAGYDRTIRLWDTRSYDEVARLSGHQSYVKSLAFSPDGSMLVSASGDHTLRIWDTKPRRERLMARRERDALVHELEPAVLLLFEKYEDPERVIERIDANPSMTGRRREIARQLVLREAIARRRAKDEL